jgi:hypothetical protein
MINLLLWALIFAFTTSMFGLSVKLGGVARAFEGINVTLVQNGVHAHAETESPFAEPYFDKPILEEIVGSYLSERLQNYAQSGEWEVHYTYDAYEIDPSNALSEEAPQKFQIDFACHSALFAYENERRFRLVKGASYEL